MNILYGVNDTAYKGAELSIYSLLTHNKGVNIFIFTMDVVDIPREGLIERYMGVTPEQKSVLTKMVQYLDPTSTITFVDGYEAYSQHIAGNRNETSPFTPFASLRLLADILLPEIDDIWYLDCDTVVQESFKDKYYECLNSPLDVDYFAYAVPHTIGWQGTMISGVMFMNLKKMRQSGFLERCRRYLFTHDCPFYDQDAIANAGPWGELPESYGYCLALNKCCYTPVILHFTCDLTPKIYDLDYGEHYFYRKFSHLQKYQKGINLIHNLIENNCI